MGASAVAVLPSNSVAALGTSAIHAGRLDGIGVLSPRIIDRYSARGCAMPSDVCRAAIWLIQRVVLSAGEGVAAMPGASAMSVRRLSPCSPAWRDSAR